MVMGSRKWLAALGCVIVFLAALAVRLETRAADLRRRLTQKDAELAGRVEQAKQAVAKDLEEKYAADRVSYQAMAKRLELEKLKTAGKP